MVAVKVADNPKCRSRNRTELTPPVPKSPEGVVASPWNVGADPFSAEMEAWVCESVTGINPRDWIAVV
jgi:hypothetical protein